MFYLNGVVEFGDLLINALLLLEEWLEGLLQGHLLPRPLAHPPHLRFLHIN